MTLLDMENKESILSALNGTFLFELTCPDLEVGSSTPPPILEEYLREVSKNGLTLYVIFLRNI